MNDGIFINQSKYIRDFLKRFDMKNVKFCATPMSTKLKLDNDINRKLVDVIKV